MITAPRLLVIDDDPLEGALVGEVLRESFPDADVSSLADATVALESVRVRAPDALFVDFNMPKMNGLRLGEAMLAERPHLPMVLMTSVGNEGLAADAFRHGFSDYIPKYKLNAENARRTVARAIEHAAQARTIEQQRQEIEHFASALAHDFKQPIRQIKTFSQAIREELALPADDGVARYLTFMHAAADRLSMLVDVMLQYTLLNKQPDLSPVDMNAVVEDVRATLAQVISEADAQFTAEDLPLVCANKMLMMQVLQNLVANAIRYNKNSRPSVQILAMPGRTDGAVQIHVEDDGIGVPAELREEIFGPLVRLHSASEYPGTGLGLTIARKAMRAQNGDIWCTLRPGGGSVFILEIARADARAHV